MQPARYIPTVNRRPGTQPIRVNQRTVTRDEIDREVQYHPARNQNDARRQAAMALVVRELLLQRAATLAIEASPAEDESQEEALIRVLIERECDAPEPTDADCQRYFEQNCQRFRTPDIHDVSHIFFPAPNDDADLRAEARAAARTVLDEMNGDCERFAEAARAHSRCPSRDNGGHLGLIERGQTAPEFEKALSRLPVGAITQHPLETRYGFHLVLIHHREPGQPLPFEVVHSDIAAYLREQVQRRALSQYVKVLAGDADINGIDLEAATSPLVQ